VILRSLLAPPGRGIYTVSTGGGRIANMQEAWLGTADAASVEAEWIKRLDSLKTHDRFLLGIPSDSGGGILRGAAWGPTWIRQVLAEMGTAGKICDLGDARVHPQLLLDRYISDATLKSVKKAMHGDDHSPLPVAPLSIAEAALTEIYRQNPKAFVLTLGGDHSIAYASLRAYLMTRDPAHVGVIHFDAHTDLLRERLGIDVCFGSWTSWVLDLLPNKKQWVQLGIRASGKPKEHWESNFGLIQHWADELKLQDPAQLANLVALQFQTSGVKEIYVTFDVDALDATEMSATGTPEVGGLKSAWCAAFMNALNKHIPIRGADICEAAPDLRGAEAASTPALKVILQSLLSFG
jgi:agmatinase